MSRRVVFGDKELIRELSNFAKPAQRNKLVRPAVREAAAAINKKAKANVVQETGLLRKSLGIKTKTKNGNVYAIVGPRYGFIETVSRVAPDGRRYTVKSNPVKYAHLVENGTSRHPAMPFLRPAYDSTNSRQIISRRLQHELRKQAQSAQGRQRAKVGRGLAAALRKAAK